MNYIIENIISITDLVMTTIELTRLFTTWRRRKHDDGNP